jgi:hypothetical protein
MTPDKLAEINEWIGSISPEERARDLIRTAQARGAKIKKGNHTERVLVDLLTAEFAASPLKQGVASLGKRESSIK